MALRSLLGGAAGASGDHLALLPAGGLALLAVGSAALISATMATAPGALEGLEKATGFHLQSALAPSQWKMIAEAAILLAVWNVVGGLCIVLSSLLGATPLASRARAVLRAARWKDACLALGFAGAGAAVYSSLGEEAKRKLRRWLRLGDWQLQRRQCAPLGGHITRRDLEGFKSKVEVAELRGTPRAWSPLGEKETAFQSSQCYARPNAADPIEGCHTRCMQMLVRNVFEERSLQDVHAFWLDDAYRAKWDQCFVSSEHIKGELAGEGMGRGWGGEGSASENGDETPVQIVRWVRKYPAFSPRREYLIARRCFREGDTLYVITKAVDLDVPRRLDRVTEYFSSWRVRLVPSPKHEGKFAVETVLLHYEDLGLPNYILKLALRTFFGWFVNGIEHRGIRGYVPPCKAQRGVGGDSNPIAVDGSHSAGPWKRRRAAAARGLAFVATLLLTRKMKNKRKR